MVLGTAATIALYVVLIFVLFFALIAVSLLGAIAFGLLKLSKLAEAGLTKIDPVLGQVNQTLITAQKVTSNVGEKADGVLSRGEDITEDLAVKIEKTSTVVQKSVTEPLVNLSSLIAGISKGISAFSGDSNSKNGRG